MGTVIHSYRLPRPDDHADTCSAVGGIFRKLYYPEHEQKFSTEHSEAKLELDPKKKDCFILKIDGVSVFQWFRQKVNELLAKLGITSTEKREGLILIK